MNSNTLEVAIALAGIYLLLAIVLSILIEAISSICKWRSKLLHQNITNLLGDERLAKSFYGHPTVRSLYSKRNMRGKNSKASRLPSSIEPSTFSSVLLSELFAEQRDDPAAVSAARPLTAKLLAECLPKLQEERPTLRPLVTRLQNCFHRAKAMSSQVEGEAKEFGPAFRVAVEKLFAESIYRLQGRYKRLVYFWSLLIAFLICFTFQVDTIELGKRLYEDSQLADTISASSEALTGETVDPGATFTSWREHVAALEIGPVWATRREEFSLLAYILGVLISAFAIAQGAPFWFDLIGRFVRMKSGGNESADEVKRLKKADQEVGKNDYKEAVFLLPKLSRDGQLRAHISALRTPPPGFSAMAASVLAGLSSRAYSWTAKNDLFKDRTGAEWSVTNLGHVSGGRFGTDHDDFQPDTQVFAVEASDPSILVLVFRGTEPNRLPDIWTNLKFDRERLPGGHGHVHRGFLGALDAPVGEPAKPLQKLLEERVRSYTEGKGQFWVTGHSLGGALAHLFVARWLAANPDRKRHLAGSYTFGAPRIGDKTFAKFLDEASPGRVIRLVNDLDLVPRVPFMSQGFRHTKAYYRFDADGDLILGERFLVRIASILIERLRDRKVRSFSSMSGELIGDHSIDEYYRLCTAVVNRHGDIQTRPFAG